MAWYKVGGGGVKSDEVTAVKANVLSGKTALTNDSNDEVATGIMTNNGAVADSIGVGGTYTIAEGYHNGSGTVVGPVLNGTADPGDVLTGETYYKDTGVKIYGTMPNNGAISETIGVNGSYSIPAGYTSGGTVSQNITTHTDSGNRSIGVNGSTSYPAGYYYNAHGASQSITTHNDSGNVSIGVNGSKSYPAGYYYNAHGAAQSITTYNDSGNTAIGFGDSKSYPAGYYYNAHGAYTSITDRRGWYGGVGVGGTTYIPEGYHNGNGYVYGPSDGNLVAGNIRSGVSIFGVSGNVNKYGSASEVTGLDGTDNISTTNSGTIQMNYHVANLGFYCQGFTAGYSGDTSKGCLLNDNCLAFSTRSGTGYQATYRSNGWAHNAGVPDYHCPRVWGTGDSMYVTYWGYF